MENFAMMDNQFAALTEEEMMMIDGGWAFYGIPVDIFTVSLPYLISVVKLVALYVDLLFVHMVASEVDLVQDLVVLAMVAVLTTVVLQAQTFLTNIFCFDIKPLVRLDLDKRLFSVKVTLGLFFK